MANFNKWWKPDLDGKLHHCSIRHHGANAASRIFKQFLTKIFIKTLPRITTEKNVEIIKQTRDSLAIFWEHIRVFWLKPHHRTIKSLLHFSSRFRFDTRNYRLFSQTMLRETNEYLKTVNENVRKVSLAQPFRHPIPWIHTNPSSFLCLFFVFSNLVRSMKFVNLVSDIYFILMLTQMNTKYKLFYFISM